jgi:hypothetical protein
MGKGEKRGTANPATAAPDGEAGAVASGGADLEGGAAMGQGENRGTAKPATGAPAGSEHFGICFQCGVRGEQLRRCGRCLQVAYCGQG